MKTTFKLMIASVLIIALSACGDKPTTATTTGTSTTGTTTTGTTTTGTTTTSSTGVGGSGVGGSLPVATITVSKSIATAISSKGSVVVTANLVDKNGTAVTDGTIVDFSTDLAGTSITATALTVGGAASATFDANNKAGTAIVTASSGGVSGFVTIEITPSPPALITVDLVEPSQVGVTGSGLAQSAIMTFNVTDAYGNLVSDGTTVNFTIGAGLGGGESVTPASATTVGGKVRATVIAGKKSGLLGINATVANTTIATTGSLVVQGGIGIASNFAIETESASFEGFDRIGNTNKFTIFLADIFGNPVKSGTQVSFLTETGSIPSAALDAAGIATVTYTTPGGSDPGGVLKGHPIGAGTGKAGYLTVLAMAKGQEPFSDNNNNGIYDAGDTFTPALHDFGEPFVDANENGIHDVGEPYNDSNLDGVYSGPNGVHDVDTVIWNSIVVVLSTKDYTVTSVGGPLSYTFTVLDKNNNPVDSKGTYAASLSFTAAASPGTITGIVSSGLPFGVSYSLVTANPAVPIWVPTFTNSATTAHLVGDVMKVEFTTPSLTTTIDGF